MAPARPPLVFSVRRQEAVLVTPAKPTPHEFKLLSDIDDQQGLRFKISLIYLFPSSDIIDDPVMVLKEALAKLLVFYYPFAGRLREGPNGKLLVECNAEGVLLVEADAADVQLSQLGYLPPFPCQEQLIYDVEEGVTGSPLILIQVTRLICGGFILAVRYNHTMADGPGIIQFLQAWTEMARGSDTPSIQPIWARELLTAPFQEQQHQLPKITVPQTPPIDQLQVDLVHQSFLLSPSDVCKLKSCVGPQLGRCSRFDVLMALMWKSRSLALYSGIPDAEEVCVVFHVNCRGKSDPVLPKGYYGNAFALGVARSTISKLMSQPLDYAVQLVGEAKKRASLADHLRGKDTVTLADLNVPFRVGRTYLVSDVADSGFNKLDFGWGMPSCSSPALLATWSPSGGHSKFLRFWNGDGILVPICLPRQAMDKFVREVETVIKLPTAEEMEPLPSVSSKL